MTVIGKFHFDFNILLVLAALPSIMVVTVNASVSMCEVKGVIPIVFQKWSDYVGSF
jgi:hypothetical protein